jgi:hypothetical protein
MSIEHVFMAGVGVVDGSRPLGEVWTGTAELLSCPNEEKKMILKRFLPYSAAIAIAFLPGVVRADTDIDSKAGLTACLLDSTGACATSETTVATGVDPLWEPNYPTNPSDPTDKSAYWIGAVDSGYNGADYVASQTYPVYRITDTFTASTAATLELDVWADDSVNVYLDGVEETPYGTNVPGSTCSGVPTSCTSNEGGVFNENVSTGGHILTFDVYQTGTTTGTNSNPTGLLYTGNVPEPGSVSILLAMLVGVAGFAGILKKKLA